tara:strand:- start:733 stop:1149 length:417 start_codon:yes stop_codon:yes gene_type:complete
MADKDTGITRLNDSTTVAMPLRNIITIILVSGLAVWGYFNVAERLNQLSTTLTMLQISVEANNEFRIRWPRGELGALPDDSEQFMLIKQLREQFDRLSEKIEEGRAPADQKQTLRLEFYEDRLRRIEEILGRNGYGSK